jgi:capsular exopolysaccharide synthesis family protein
VLRQQVVQEVKADLRSRLAPEDLRTHIDVSVDPNSFQLKIKGTAREAEAAADLANAFSRADARITTRDARRDYRIQARRVQRRLDALPRLRRTQLQDRNAVQRAQLQDQLTRLASLSGVAAPVEVADVARVPGSPDSPKPVRNTLGALIFGLFFGTALAYLRSSLDHRLRSSVEVEEVYDKPVVALVRAAALGHSGSPQDRVGKKAVGPLSDQDLESFRILRHNVRYLEAAGEDLSPLLVTSAMAEEGKSTVSSCLAMAEAASGRRTLLVECDLRRPVLAQRFGLGESPGLTDYLTGNAQPSEIVRVIDGVPTDELASGEQPGLLACIVAGTSPPRPADLLASDRFKSFLQDVSQAYDAVILDSAPLLSVADTLEIVPHAARILVCSRLDRSTRDQATAARAVLERLPERPTGIALTGVREMGDGYYGYYGAPAAGAGAKAPGV